MEMVSVVFPSMFVFNCIYLALEIEEEHGGRHDCGVNGTMPGNSSEKPRL